MEGLAQQVSAGPIGGAEQADAPAPSETDMRDLQRRYEGALSELAVLRQQMEGMQKEAEEGTAQVHMRLGWARALGEGGLDLDRLTPRLCHAKHC